MTATTMSSRAFNQDTSRAKKAAAGGPVFITDRGEPAHVLLTIEEYRRLAGNGVSLLEVVQDMSEEADFDWYPAKIEVGLQSTDFG